MFSPSRSLIEEAYTPFLQTSSSLHASLFLFKTALRIGVLGLLVSLDDVLYLLIVGFDYQIKHVICDIDGIVVSDKAHSFKMLYSGRAAARKDHLGVTDSVTENERGKTAKLTCPSPESIMILSTRLKKVDRG